MKTFFVESKHKSEFGVHTSLLEVEFLKGELCISVVNNGFHAYIILKKDDSMMLKNFLNNHLKENEPAA